MAPKRSRARSRSRSPPRFWRDQVEWSRAEVQRAHQQVSSLDSRLARQRHELAEVEQLLQARIARLMQRVAVLEERLGITPEPLPGTPP